MEPVRIACVRYLNTAPLVEGLEGVAGVTLVPTVPSRIAEMVAGGRADVGLASIVDGASPAAGLALVPAGMIGSDGPTLTVRVFSAVPLDRIVRLHADTDSHTSVVLARLLLERLYGARVGLVSFDARERIEVGRATRAERYTGGSEDGSAGGTLDECWPESVLLIGDKVVADAPPSGRYPYQLDLGEAWRGWTGLPFVYAVWMCRAPEAATARIRLASALLDRQRRHNATRLGWIARTRACGARWPAPLAASYLGENLRFEVTPRAREGAERFVAEAAGAGLLPAGRLAWADAAGCRIGS